MNKMVKIYQKRRILGWFFRFFWPDTTLNIFCSNMFRINSIWAFDWCMNCYIWKKKIFNIFLIRVPPFHQKNGKKIFHHDMTIHTPIESPYRVYLKHVVLRIIYFEIRLKKWPKVPKCPKIGQLWVAIEAPGLTSIDIWHFQIIIWA